MRVLRISHSAAVASDRDVLAKPRRVVRVVAPPRWRPDERISEVLRQLAEQRPDVEVALSMWCGRRPGVNPGDVVWLLDLAQMGALGPGVRVLTDPVDPARGGPSLPAAAVVAWLRRMLDEELRAVAYLTHVARPSGAELALLRQLPHVPGVLPTIVVAEDGPLVARYRAAGLPTVVLPLAGRTREVRRRTAAQALAQPAAVLDTAVYVVRLRALLRGLHIDLVHTNSLKAAVYGPPAAKLSQIPVVVHLRDRLAADYLGKHTSQLVRRWIHRMADGVLVNSAATLDALGVPVQATAVLPSAVVYDPSLLGRRRARPPRSFTVGMLGRLAHWKGQHVAIEAFAQAFSDRPDARLCIAGGALFGEEAYARELQEQAERLGVGDRVELLGHVDDIEGFLASIDVLVHASIIPEPFGQVVLEGMSAGVPVIAADAGGPAEIIRDGIDGFLVPPGDASALAERLRWCASPDGDVRGLVDEASATLSRYAPDLLGRRIRAFYDEVAGPVRAR